MELALASIMVDISLNIASWLQQTAVSRKDRKTLELVATLQNFASSGSITEWTASELVGAMQGRMTTPLARTVLDSESFAGIAKEIFLCELAGAQDTKADATKESLQILFQQTLSDKVANKDARSFADFIYLSVRNTSRTSIEQLRSKHPEALINVTTMASNRRIHATLEAIENHLYLSRRLQAHGSREDLQIWRKKYTRQVVSAHGYIQPPDFNNSRRISIEDLYVGPKFIEHHSDSQLEHDHRSMLERIDRTVILGDPGGGKSTFTAVLANQLAKGGLTGAIPFHITLRDYAKYHDEFSILNYIVKELETRYQCEAPSGAIEHILTSGEGVVIFDGLDELIDTSKRRAITSKVEAFSLEYPLSKILVTSRRVGYAEAKLDPATFTTYLIGEFEEPDVRSFVEKWFRSQGEEDFSGVDPQHLARSFMTQSEAVPDLRKNPLMLSLMCIIFKGENFIPRSRPEVYSRCANLLFEKWDGHRSIEVPLRARDHIDPAMKFFAFWMLTSNQAENGVTSSVLVAKMTEYLHPRALSNEDEARRASEEFIEFCKGRAWVFSDAGTTSGGESLWTFTHRTFMEYFAAAHLNRMFDTPERLARELLPRVAAQEWDVIAQLAIQIANEKERGSERALGVMLNDKIRRTQTNRQNVLGFITRCIDFAVLSEAFVFDLAKRCITAVELVPESEVEAWLSYPGSPPWSLLSNGLRYTAPIEQAISDQLTVYFVSTDTSLRVRAASMALWCSYTFSTPGDIFTRISDSRLSRWSRVFGDLARKHSLEIREASEQKPALNLYMMLCGFEDIRVAYSRALERGVSPSKLLFSSETFWWHTAPTSLSDFIVRRIFAFSGSDPTAGLERVSAFYIRAVEELLNNGPVEAQPQGIGGPFFSPTLDGLPSYALSNTTILDGVVLVMLGMFENMHAAGLTIEQVNNSQDPWKLLFTNSAVRHSESEVPAWFLKNVSDVWLKQFIVQWMRGERSIFEQITKTTAVADASRPESR